MIDPKKIETLIAYTLKSAENGFPNSIQAVVDVEGNPPSESNNFLWNDEKESFEGRFMSNNNLYEFKIEKTGTNPEGYDEFSSEYSMADKG